MREMLMRIFCLVAATHLLFGCSTLQQTGPTSDTASIQSQRASSAELALLELEEIDALIKLNNRILSNHIESEFQTQTTNETRYTFRDVSLGFKRQYIQLESIVDILDDNKNMISATVSGEVLLHFGGDRLEWFPRFNRLKIHSRNFNFQGEQFSEPTPEITKIALHNLNTETLESLTRRNSNTIPTNTVPLGEIQLGASLSGLSASPALVTGVLTGTTRVIDSLILIDSAVTSIALDMEFNPVRTPCPPGSDCTMYAEPAYQPQAETILTRVNIATARQSFAVLKDEFETRTNGLSIAGDKPAVALIEISRLFFQNALQSSLSELSLDAEFSTPDLSAPEFTASLRPFNVEHISCERLDCPELPVCKADLSQCKRLRDTRDCTNCTFRNPLNNRCVNEEIDPVCESERNLQNDRYDAERAVCISEADALKRDCEKTNTQSLLACQNVSDKEYSSCELVKRNLGRLKPGASLATLNAKTQASGTLIANFSNIRIEDDLNRLKLDMGLKSDLNLKGKLRFKPNNLKRPLAECIATWNAPFASRFVTTPSVNNLISNIHSNGDELTTHWSGFGMTIHADPSPLEAILAGNPGMLSDCNIGLTMRTVEKALRGDDVDFFLGQLELEIQPLPTTLRLAPARIRLGKDVYSGKAVLSSKNLRFEISD